MRDQFLLQVFFTGRKSYSGLTSHQSRTFLSINEVTLWVPWCMRLMLECETLSMAVWVPSPLYSSKLRTCRRNWLWPMPRLCVCECTMPMPHQVVHLQRICSSLCSQGHPPLYSHHHLNYTIITNLRYLPWITWSLGRLSGRKGAKVSSFRQFLLTCLGYELPGVF